MSAATSPPTADDVLPCQRRPCSSSIRRERSSSHWGGPGAGYEWPRSPGGIAVDAKGNVWIAAAGVTETRWRARTRGRARSASARRMPTSSSFRAAGKFLLQIGKAGKTGGNDSKTGTQSPARDRGRLRRQRGLRRRRRRQSPRRRLRRRRPVRTSGTGAPTVRPQARLTRFHTTRTARRRSSSVT